MTSTTTAGAMRQEEQLKRALERKIDLGLAKEVQSYEVKINSNNEKKLKALKCGSGHILKY